MGVADADISENGYIRQLTDDAIEYKTIKLSEKCLDVSEPEMMILNGKSYFVSRPTVFKESNLSQSNKRAIHELLSNVPDHIPSDPLLFRIWQMEYIEEGLREL